MNKKTHISKAKLKPVKHKKLPSDNDDTNLWSNTDNKSDELNETNDTKPKSLNIKQELFCQYFVSWDSLWNWTKAYSLAYWKDLENPKEEKTSRSNAYKLLTNADICERISELLEKNWMNDQFVDTQLFFLINQFWDLWVKLRAISEYNKIKKRYVESDSNDKGMELLSSLLVSVDWKTRNLVNE